MDYQDLKRSLDRGETVIHDAAVSTELQAMGVPMESNCLERTSQLHSSFKRVANA